VRCSSEWQATMVDVRHQETKLTRSWASGSYQPRFLRLNLFRRFWYDAQLENPVWCRCSRSPNRDRSRLFREGDL